LQNGEAPDVPTEPLTGRRTEAIPLGISLPVRSLRLRQTHRCLPQATPGLLPGGYADLGCELPGQPDRALPELPLGIRSRTSAALGFPDQATFTASFPAAVPN